jgi:hypothetical protein
LGFGFHVFHQRHRQAGHSRGDINQQFLLGTRILRFSPPFQGFVYLFPLQSLIELSVGDINLGVSKSSNNGPTPDPMNPPCSSATYSPSLLTIDPGRLPSKRTSFLLISDTTFTHVRRNCKSAGASTATLTPSPVGPLRLEIQNGFIGVDELKPLGDGLLATLVGEVWRPFSMRRDPAHFNPMRQRISTCGTHQAKLVYVTKPVASARTIPAGESGIST